MKDIRYIFFLVLLLLFTFVSNATPLVLSDQATISVLTCSPGNELYSQFGHTAIRIKDPVSQFDIVFNYGTFDFTTRFFYFKFARGTLQYKLSYTRTSIFMDNCENERRSVYAQTLNLDSISKQRLWELLVKNYQPENSSYLYNFLYDNCTTRTRDVIAETLDGKIRWTGKGNEKSFWNLLDEYLEVSPWIQWGIHTILGSPANQKATSWEQMFLPDYLMYGLDSAYCNGSPLVQPVQAIYIVPERENNTQWFLSPFFSFLLCFLLLVILIQYCKKQNLLRGVAVPLFIMTGTIGCLLIFLGYFTLHPTTAPNFNLIWANPLNLIVSFFFYKKTLPCYIKGYLYFYLCILLVGFILWFLFIPAVLYSNMIIIVLMIYLVCKLVRH